MTVRDTSSFQPSPQGRGHSQAGVDTEVDGRMGSLLVLLLKDTEAMRVSSARCAFIVLTLVGLAGCNCCDRWAMPTCSMPNLAFWKSSPFKASSDATGIPERPSALASRPTMPGPGAGYTTGSTTAPPYVENTAGTTVTGSYPTTQQANWSIPSSPYSSAGATVSESSTYVAPQAGAYGMQGSVSPGGSSPAVSAAVPSPLWASVSITHAERIRSSAWSFRMATTMSLTGQNPRP